MYRIINAIVMLFIFIAVSYAQDIVIKPENAKIRLGETITYSMIVTKKAISPSYFYDGNNPIFLKDKEKCNNMYQWKYKPKNSGVFAPVLVYDEDGQSKSYVLDVQVDKDSFHWKVLVTTLIGFISITIIMMIKSLYRRTTCRWNEISISVCVVRKLLDSLEKIPDEPCRVKLKLSLLPRWSHDLPSTFWRPASYSKEWAIIYHDISSIIACLKLQQNEEAKELIKNVRNQLDTIRMPKFWSSFIEEVRKLFI